MTDTGFSDVDGSAREATLIDCLALYADRLAGARREGYDMLRLYPGAASMSDAARAKCAWSSPLVSVRPVASPGSIRRKP